LKKQPDKSDFRRAFRRAARIAGLEEGAGDRLYVLYRGWIKRGRPPVGPFLARQFKQPQQRRLFPTEPERGA
jgi:hypothetical protein